MTQDQVISALRKKGFIVVHSFAVFPDSDETVYCLIKKVKSYMTHHATVEPSGAVNGMALADYINQLSS